MVQIGSVLVRSKCLDEQICFAPNPYIGPESEQMHHLKRGGESQNWNTFGKICLERAG